MNDSIEGILDIEEERDNAALVGLMVGFLAGLLVGLLARSESIAQVRQSVTETLGAEEPERNDEGFAGKLQHGTTKVQETVVAGRSLATDLVNKSPLPVTIGADGSAGAGESEGSGDVAPDEDTFDSSDHEATSTASREVAGMRSGAGVDE